MAKRVFILHGWGGTAGSGWKGWLEIELHSGGFEVFQPQMPDADTPHLEEWLAVLQKLVGKPDKETYFVGHSLGATCILRYLERLGANEKIAGAVLVACPMKNAGIPWIAEFFSKPFDWGKIRKRCGKFASINSDNDHYVPVEDGKTLEEKLGAALIVLHSRGHFSSSEGCTRLPEALRALLEMCRG